MYHACLTSGYNSNKTIVFSVKCTWHTVDCIDGQCWWQNIWI